MVQQPKPKIAAPEVRGTEPGETALVRVYEISKLLASVNRLEVDLRRRADVVVELSRHAPRS